MPKISNGADSKPPFKVIQDLKVSKSIQLIQAHCERIKQILNI